MPKATQRSFPSLMVPFGLILAQLLLLTACGGLVQPADTAPAPHLPERIGEDKGLASVATVEDKALLQSADQSLSR